LALPEVQAALPEPSDPETFEICRLDFQDRERHAAIFELHRDLLRLRRGEPAFIPTERDGLDAAVIGPQAFIVRYFARTGDRLLVVNLGGDLACQSIPNPLIAPPVDRQWQLRWSSAEPRYGGVGTAQVETESGWRIPAETALWFEAAVKSEM
jgi:maltooligosyltrehalose trehalohydrolase